MLSIGKFSIPSGVLGESGRSPLICTYLKRRVKSWRNVLKLREETLVYKAYKLQLQLIDSKVDCWSGLSKFFMNMAMEMSGFDRGVRNDNSS